MVQLAGESELDAFVSTAGAAFVEFYTERCGVCRSMESVDILADGFVSGDDLTDYIKVHIQ